MVERRALVGRPSVVGGYEWRIVNGKLWSDTALVGRPSAVGGKGQWAVAVGRERRALAFGEGHATRAVGGRGVLGFRC
jgi:hypothetical protein